VEWTARTNYLPWVTCGQKPAFETASNTLQLLLAPDFDPRQIVFLPTDKRKAVSVASQTQCRVVSSRYSPNRVEVGVKAQEASLVVFAQTFHHPWRAAINGKPTEILRANHAFQAVQVPPGDHQVVLSYHDRSFYRGAAVSTLSALLCAGLWWLGGRGSRNPHEAPTPSK
jgi:hypothetical protein